MYICSKKRAIFGSFLKNNETYNETLNGTKERKYGLYCAFLISKGEKYGRTGNSFGYEYIHVQGMEKYRNTCIWQIDRRS